MEQISSQGVLKGTYTKLACLFVYLITGSHGWIYLRKKKKKRTIQEAAIPMSSVLVRCDENPKGGKNDGGKEIKLEGPGG